VGLSLRVIKRRLPVGVSLAWRAIILIFPFVGAVTYLMVGGYRLGRRRASVSRPIARMAVTEGPTCDILPDGSKRRHSDASPIRGDTAK
jgi:hypothetical protein